MRNFWIGLLVVVVVVPFMLATAQGEPSATTRAQLNVRSGPGTEHPVTASISKNTVVTLEGRNGVSSWMLVRAPDGTRGWVSASYLTLTNGTNILAVPVVEITVPGEAASTVCTGPQCSNPSVSQGDANTTAQLNVRSGPGQGNQRIGRLSLNTAVMIEGRNGSGDWVLVRSLDGSIRGWVSSAYLTLNNGNALANYPVVEEAVAASTSSSASSSSSTTTTTVAASYAPEGRSIWQANSGPDITSGTCDNPPLVMCSHLTAITLNDNGTISWRGQELKTYSMRQSPRNPNVYSYSGRNGLNNADMRMVLTFNSEGSWSMTMTQIFDDDPDCTHTFYYTATRNW